MDWHAAMGDQTARPIILSNLVTMAVAVIQNWGLAPLLVVYWMQSVTIGVFNFIRILSLEKFSTEGVRMGRSPVSPGTGVKIAMALFFAVHYGVFHIAYLFFILMYGVSSLFIPGFSVWDYAWAFLLGAMFFASHLYSYVKNRPKDPPETNIGHVMFRPYLRIIPMHLTLMFGGFISFGFFAAGGLAWGVGNRLMLAFFLVLKTAADVGMHYLEHHGADGKAPAKGMDPVGTRPLRDDEIKALKDFKNKIMK